MNFYKSEFFRSNSFVNGYESDLFFIFKNKNEWKYVFKDKVETSKEFYGYAESIHFWKTLKGIKNYLEQTDIHYMHITKNIGTRNFEECFDAYKLEYGEFKLTKVNLET